MSNSLKSVVTRFRAYQLGQAGSSFSYYANGHFTLIESVITDLNNPQLQDELLICGKNKIDTLHITSWDQDHCSISGLKWILTNLLPTKIEYPGYEPHTENGTTCLSIIRTYQHESKANGYSVKTQSIDPPFIASLNIASELGYKDIFYHPKQLYSSANNNSTIKFFRRGSFNVLSLGDVEDQNIAAMLRRCKTLCREVDIMILAHHGADNGFTNKKFLERIRPSVAICSSNFSNQYDHPSAEIRKLLFEQGIQLVTTKTGDVVIESTGNHSSSYQVTNLYSNSVKVSSSKKYKPRKSHWLSMNPDSLRNLLRPGFKGIKRL